MILRLSHSHGANLKSKPAIKTATAGERRVISSGSILFHVNPVLLTRQRAHASKLADPVKKNAELNSNPPSQMRQMHKAIVANAAVANSSNFHQLADR